MYKNDCLVNEETRKAVIGKLRDGSFKRLKTVINKLTKENISFRVKNVYFRVRSSQIFENSVIMGLNVQLNIT
ncbi:MAG: hypothetical protein N3E37_05020 [Candidatus Micrarchaeota archaeon]|nr:hypothetical protein [Candidatus Micrarchaeota archaeon]